MKYSVIFLLFAITSSFSQEFRPTHIGIGSQSYYEIMKIDDDHFEVLSMYSENNEVREEVLKVENLKSFKREKGLQVLIKTKRLEKNWFLNKDVQYTSKGEEVYRVWVKKDGSKRLSFFKKSDVHEFGNWCTPREQPQFISRKYEHFETLLIVKDNTLNVLYYSKSKGLNGYIEKVATNEACSC